MGKIDVVLMLTEPMLGTASANADLVREFIASKRPAGVDKAEIESLPEIAEGGRHESRIPDTRK